jgi:hypothetical protein
MPAPSADHGKILLVIMPIATVWGDRLVLRHLALRCASA